MRAHHLGPVPGERLLHPVALAALSLLLLNDHCWKAAFPCWLTGKLSDFCGLVFFPLFLEALWEWGCAAARRFRGHRSAVLLACAILTGLVFAMVKTWAPAAQAYSVVWGLLGWPLAALRTLDSASDWPRPGHARIVSDPTDLIALPCLALALWVGDEGGRRIQRRSGSRSRALLREVP